MDLGIRGRTAVVTGADSGMGLATARMLLEEGARVMLSDQTQDALDEAASKLSGEFETFAADLSRPAHVDGLRDAALKRFGRVDILVHSAGITGPTGAFHTLSDDDWMQALSVDFMSAVRVVRAFVTGMRDAGWGRVVLFGSEDAEQPYVDELPYCAAKAAILNLSKGLSKTYAKHGVLVNAVSPAFVATPMTDAMMRKRAEKNGTSFEDAIASFLDEERPGMELKRRGEADEVAAAVVFLCSERASFVNGINFRVDSGSVMTV
jgi:NAD(P)-dependent dehydrogenase (short-subunit alcohol dehydrogenase family)